MTISTIGVSAAVTPAVVKTCLSHYTNRKPRHQKPTAHISYDEGLNLVRTFLEYASHHTVEDLQAFTAQWVPCPSWVRIESVDVPQSDVSKAADALIAQLGPGGVKEVGGTQWWQWRRKNGHLKAEWIEMRADYHTRQRSKEKCRRIMLYVHGGGYFFGSVDEHRYQLQRHARKLKARVFAPRYRLAPQFPFPCGLLDNLAVYLYLLTLHDPSEILLAGDSAGGGMVVSMLCVLRDQGLPLPAGGILISPWVDLTHSFPSLVREDTFDYIPAHGFMQKPSASWPPPLNEELIAAHQPTTTKNGDPSSSEASPTVVTETNGGTGSGTHNRKYLSLQIDGREVSVKEQIQMYTTNEMITHPLVSPVLQPSLGGLPPLLILVGGGERLRDEQIFLAHKAANPTKYPLGQAYRQAYDPDDKLLNKYKPTSVQLQVWEDLCHVAPTLSFTRPAKYMYRSIAQFGAWALARAQQTSIEILDDDNISIISTSSASDEEDGAQSQDNANKQTRKTTRTAAPGHVGKAGDPLPAFKNNMIRQQVDRHGTVYRLPPSTDIPALQMSIHDVGIVKEGPVKKWMMAKKDWDTKYTSTARKVQKQRMRDLAAGSGIGFGEGENPPPSALARRRKYADVAEKPPKKSWGLGLWSLWGSKHDERAVEKEEEMTKKEAESEERPNGIEQTDETSGLETTITGASPSRGPSGSRTRKASRGSKPEGPSRSRSRRRTITVQDRGQTEGVTVPPAVGVVEPKEADDYQNFRSQTQTPAGDHPSPVFVPKFKTAAHLRSTSRDASDTMSTFSQRTTGDNASTMAVFSAPGVTQTETNDTADTENADSGSRPGTAEADSYGGKKHRDHLGGYDSPASRRSVERLQSHQHPGDAESALSVPLTVGSRRIDPLRSPSSQAIIQAEGVVDVVKGGKADYGSGVKKDGAIEEKEAERMVNGNTSMSERPGMYERNDSEFHTAMEKL